MRKILPFLVVFAAAGSALAATTPTISSINPSYAIAECPQFSLTVNGTNYNTTSVVRWGSGAGSNLTTTFVSSTQLSAIVPAANIATAGTVEVTVKNSTGSASNGVTFQIYDGPAITSALTGSATLGSSFSYQITANNNPVSYDAQGLPQGLTVDTTTGIISGTPSATGVFPVTISAASDPNNTCGGLATDTLTLTVNLPVGVSISAFPGQLNVFTWGSTQPSPTDTIPFTTPNNFTGNYFILYWNAPGTTTNQAIADSSNGGLTRTSSSDSTLNSAPTKMAYNPYDPTLPKTSPGATPIPDLNVWRGNPSPPNGNALGQALGQFADPRANWYITDPWPAGNYLTGSYWGGPTPQFLPLSWPDSGHNPPTPGATPTGLGQYPDAVAATGPTPDPTKTISLLSTSNTGTLASVAELGNVWDPAQLTYAVTNPGGALPDIPNTAAGSTRGAGAHTLAIGRPEFSLFDQNGMRAWQLLDVFSSKTVNNNFTNTAGLVNINTASRDVLRSLAAGILENRDLAMITNPAGQPLYPPTVSKTADQFADAVINSRPLLSRAALSAIRIAPPTTSSSPSPTPTPPSAEPFFGNSHQYSVTQTQPTEWNDPGREELFAKIYNLATTRSRNFRVFVTGQALDKNGNILSTVTKVYQVFVQPTRDTTGSPTTNPNYGKILSQQVQIKYEGSM